MLTYACLLHDAGDTLQLAMRLRHSGTHTPAPQAVLRRSAPHNPRALADAAHDVQRAAGLSWPAEAQDLQVFHGLQGLLGLQGFQGEQPPPPRRKTAGSRGG